MIFCKMNGLGNDYIFVDLNKQEITDPNRLAKKLSDRHFSIGSDGLVLIDKSDIADADMRIFNADGGEAKMCGNAIRCVAKYVYEHGYTQKKELSISTLSGVKYIQLTTKNGIVDTVKVNMGSPSLIRLNRRQVINYSLNTTLGIKTITPVDIGNYHAVHFTDDLSDENIILAKEISSHATFTDGINAELAKVIDRQNIAMRVWERGSGETMACGTGACAVVFAAYIKGLVDNSVTVHLRGGELQISYINGKIWMEGSASYNFYGEVEI